MGTPSSQNKIHLRIQSMRSNNYSFHQERLYDC
uniref:Uncharacterized protein n=1 Tax=Arundo donax TaxID=35708 RepID=A0A0A9CJZ7_ARUDO